MCVFFFLEKIPTIPKSTCYQKTKYPDTISLRYDLVQSLTSFGLQPLSATSAGNLRRLPNRHTISSSISYHTRPHPPGFQHPCLPFALLTSAPHWPPGQLAQLQPRFRPLRFRSEFSSPPRLQSEASPGTLRVCNLQTPGNTPLGCHRRQYR